MNNTPTPRTDAQINGKPCTPLEREQAELIESLEDRIRELESELEHSKQVAWNRLSDTEKDESIKFA
jgi:hypothetical protein